MLPVCLFVLWEQTTCCSVVRCDKQHHEQTLCMVLGFFCAGCFQVHTSDRRGIFRTTCFKVDTSDRGDISRAMFSSSYRSFFPNHSHHALLLSLWVRYKILCGKLYMEIILGTNNRTQIRKQKRLYKNGQTHFENKQK